MTKVAQKADYRSAHVDLTPSETVRQILAATAAAHQRFAEGGADAVVRAADVISEALLSGHKVLSFGNGGSASDAEHLVAELVGRFETERRSLAGLALTAGSSTFTAIANDYGYDRVFARQVRGWAWRVTWRSGFQPAAVRRTSNSRWRSRRRVA
jgi:phosphoheptose isomerase